LRLGSASGVGRLLGWSRPKVSRIEAGKTVPKAADVEALLNLYLPDPAKATPLLQLAHDARTRGWWTAFSDVFTGSYVGLEDGATAIRTWEAQLIPCLLQTEAYARTVIAATCPDAPDSVHRQVQARMALLTRDGPRIIDFGIARAADITAITRTGVSVGTPAFMAPEQFRASTEITSAADVFMFGLVMCYAAGLSPFGEGPPGGTDLPGRARGTGSGWASLLVARPGRAMSGETRGPPSNGCGPHGVHGLRTANRWLAPGSCAHDDRIRRSGESPIHRYRRTAGPQSERSGSSPS
jgi:hypothetical protein